MAFAPRGIKISYDSEEFINKLQSEIDRHGNSDFMVDVVTENIADAVIYKEFSVSQLTGSVPDGKRRMTAAALMTAYEIQDSVL